MGLFMYVALPIGIGIVFGLALQRPVSRLEERARWERWAGYFANTSACSSRISPAPSTHAKNKHDLCVAGVGRYRSASRNEVFKIVEGFVAGKQNTPDEFPEYF